MFIITSIAEVLKEKNLKVTPQRLAIYSMLKNTTKHPSVETIYKQLEKDHPAMSLATVYKTLDTFKKSGLVQELNVGEDSFRYDAHCECHPHFICEKCMEVFDLPVIDSMPVVIEELSQKTGFEIKKEQAYFYGICNHCRNN